MAFRNKKDEILGYDPDVLVIQECENPKTKGNWTEFTDWRWTGENDNKGLGVFTRNGLTIESVITEIEESKHFLPVRTELGDVLAVWAMNDEKNPTQRYIGQVYTTFQNHPDLLNEKMMVLGDFNWNIIWDDSPNSPLCGDFSETTEVLHESGLRSAYHYLTNAAFGEENDATFYMHKKADRPYHIDYVFLPESLLKSVTGVEVGEYEEWIDNSDHVPLLVDVNHKC